ncbi:MAG: PQQ-binding-like beta-propeller repeat protein [Acidimicrobiales bacterium]|nr:PQQ-binding-like beta-propeller repeat protein [Acidimicrobiales bacterium]
MAKLPWRAPHRWLASLVLVAMSATSCGRDAVAPTSGSSVEAPAAACEWPMAGRTPERHYATACPSRISSTTADQLQPEWFFNTNDVVSASPVVVDDTIYIGDWSGRFYAIDADDASVRWSFQAEVNPYVYAGQITASAVVGGDLTDRSVYFASGDHVYALDADDGTVRWKRTVGVEDGGEPTEIEGAPLLVDGKLIVGIDVHNNPNYRAGVAAFDAATGNPLWRWDGDAGAEPSGCVDVWGAPSADLSRRTVYFGTGNCPQAPAVWRPATEAIVAVDLDTGDQKWVFQPHGPNNDDLDFAGAPNLFEVGGRALVGLGNKDGTYYAVDRDTGVLVWKAEATKPGLSQPGSNFSTGGFNGASGYADGIIVGGTAVGPGPFLHGIDAASGEIVWQQKAVEATYAPPAIVNDVVFIGGNDFTLRAVELRTGKIVWSYQVASAIAGGPAIVADNVYAVAGFKEPGTDKRSENSGIYRFRLPRPGETTTTTTGGTTTTTVGVTNIRLTNPPSRCLGSPCPLPFTLKPIPNGATPAGTLLIEPDPFKVTVTASGLGPPSAWITPGTSAADSGATRYAVFISESDDNPVGGLLCVLDPGVETAAGGSCTGDSLPRLATYNRITILAVNDPSALPPIVEGLARLVSTINFDPVLKPEPRS